MIDKQLLYEVSFSLAASQQLLAPWLHNFELRVFGGYMIRSVFGFCHCEVREISESCDLVFIYGISFDFSFYLVWNL